MLFNVCNVTMENNEERSTTTNHARNAFCERSVAKLEISLTVNQDGYTIPEERYKSAVFLYQDYDLKRALGSKGFLLTR